jgi:hypothetical protein
MSKEKVAVQIEQQPLDD